MTTTTPSTAAHSAPPARAHRGAALLGLLPFIGVILFVVNAYPVVTGTRAPDWKTDIVQLGVTYMIGYAAVGAAVAHIFFGRKIARSIGWEPSPFEFEVGVANLSMGVAALLAASHTPEFWWAVIVVSSIFRIGCGIGHIREIVQQRNFAINNTAILFLNFVVPAFLLITYTAWL
jgi:hypothetical protein